MQESITVQDAAGNPVTLNPEQAREFIATSMRRLEMPKGYEDFRARWSFLSDFEREITRYYQENPPRLAAGAGGRSEPADEDGAGVGFGCSPRHSGQDDLNEGQV